MQPQGLHGDASVTRAFIGNGRFAERPACAMGISASSRP
jgi:hypothetical protein